MLDPMEFEVEPEDPSVAEQQRRRFDRVRASVTRAAREPAGDRSAAGRCRCRRPSCPVRSRPTRYLEGPRPRLFAHRGASGTHPENTLEAFAAGLAAGRRAPRAATSTRRPTATSSCSTTPILDRTTDGAGPVRERTLAEVQALDAGYRFTATDGSHPWRGRGVRVPTLDELLAAHPACRSTSR